MFDDPDRVAPPPSLSDVLDAPGEVAVWAAAARPGPDVVELVSMLDPAGVGADERVDLLVAVERQLAWLAALQQRVLASLEADPLRLGCDPDDDWTREQVAAALRLAAGTADRRLTTARQLADRLPGTAAALATGEITYLHAVKLVEAVNDLDDATAAAVEARVLPRAAAETVGQFAAAVQRAVLALDPRTGEASTPTASAAGCRSPRPRMACAGCPRSCQPKARRWSSMCSIPSPR